MSDCPGLAKSSGPKTITKPETIEDTNINGSVTVAASGVTLKHDCVTDNGEEAEASAAIALNDGASNFTVTESTVRGGNTTSESVEEALRNNYSDSGAVASKDRIENCAECLHQAWTLEDSYVISNGRAHAEESGAAHAEDWWYSNNTIVANHDTLLEPIQTDRGDLRRIRGREMRQPRDRDQQPDRRWWLHALLLPEHLR